MGLARFSEVGVVHLPTHFENSGVYARACIGRYNGTKLVQKGNVLVVTLSYRLGAPRAPRLVPALRPLQLQL